MTQRDFYHFTQGALVDVLAPLLARTLKAEAKALVLCGDEAGVKALDAALWVRDPKDWLPHGTAATPHPEWQPAYLTSAEADNPAGARYLFLTGSTESAAPDAYDRIFDLFDGGDEAAMAAARQRFRSARSGGQTVSYWRQEEGKWVKAG